MKRDIKNLYRDEQEGASKERTRREHIIHPFISSLAFHSIFASKETSGQKNDIGIPSAYHSDQTISYNKDKTRQGSRSYLLTLDKCLGI